MPGAGQVLGVVGHPAKTLVVELCPFTPGEQLGEARDGLERSAQVVSNRVSERLQVPDSPFKVVRPAVPPLVGAEGS